MTLAFHSPDMKAHDDTQVGKPRHFTMCHCFLTALYVSSLVSSLIQFDESCQTALTGIVTWRRTTPPNAASFFECATNMSSKISLLVYEWPLISSYIMSNMEYMNGPVFNIFTNLSQNWLNLRNFWTNQVILLKTLVQNWSDCVYFVKSSYLYGSTFKFCSGTSLPKPSLNTPSIFLS